jgi:hypothetical protein
MKAGGQHGPELLLYSTVCGLFASLLFSVEYGDKFGRVGDVITVVLDFEHATIEFLKNGASQGVAFANLTGTVYAAVSLTATGAAARLRIAT